MIKGKKNDDKSKNSFVIVANYFFVTDYYLIFIEKSNIKW